MTTKLEPIPINYTELSPPKSIGGSIQFLNVDTPKLIRFIDTFELNLSMFVILGRYQFEQYVGQTIFSIEVTYADNSVETIWSYQVYDTTVGFTLPQSFFDLQTYRSILSIILVANNEITLNQHDFIRWAGYMKIVEQITPTFIGGDVHASKIMPTSLTLSWGKTNYDYAIVNWGDGVTQGIYPDITISYVNIIPETPNIITLNFGTGNYNNINIVYNQAYLDKGFIGTQYGISNLAPNTYYTYSIVPYSIIGVTGNPYIVSTVTLPTIGAGSYSNINATTIALLWQGGDYAYISLYESLIGYSTITSNYPYMYIENGLTENTAYNFNLIPYNTSNLSSSTIYNPSTIIPLVTLATIGPVVSATNVTDTSVRLSWLKYSATSVNIRSTDGLINIIGVVNTYITITGLLPNRYYTFNVIAVNSNGDENLPQSPQVSILTLGHIDYIIAVNTLSTSTILEWGATSSSYYTTVNVNWNGNITSNLFSTQKAISGLTPNTIYTFNGYANNVQNIQNNNGVYATTNTLATMLGYTIPRSQITTTSFNLAWNTNATNVSVYLTNAFNQDPSQSNVYPNIYQTSCNITQLTPNTQYNFTLIPFNQYGIPNSNVPETLTAQTCTLAAVNNISYSNLTDTSLYLYYSGAYSNVYNNFMLNGSNVTLFNPKSYIQLGTGTHSLGSNYILNPNTYYTFNVIPVNNYGVSNTIDTYSTTFTTLANVKNIFINNFTEHSISVGWSNAHYKSMYVNWTDGYTHNQVGSTTLDVSYGSNYTVQSLNVNYPYTVTILPYNTTNQSNMPSQLTISTITQAFLYTAIIPAYDITTATLAWTGIMSNMQIKYYNASAPNILLNTFIIPNLDVHGNNLYNNSYTVTSLSPNTVYNFILTPINGNNVLNTSCSQQLSINTLATALSINSVALSESSIQLTWNLGNAYSVNILQYDPVQMNTTTILAATSGNSYNVTSGLLPNITYSYTLQPINNAGVSNITNVLSTSRATMATQSPIYIPYYDTTTSLIQWDINPAYNYTTINLSFTGPTNSNIYGIATNSINISQLLPNSYYTFTTYPVNSEGIINTGIAQVRTVTVDTLATVGNITTPIIRSTQIGLSIGSGAYARNLIYWSGPTSGSTSNVVGSYLATNLSPNSAYIFNVIPYNNDGVLNQANIITISLYTLAIITSISDVSTATTITSSWTTDASYVVINSYKTLDNSYIGTTTSSASTALLQYNPYTPYTPNTQYSIYITPYNSATSNIANYTRSDNGTIQDNIYTQATIYNAYTSNIGITQVDINFSGIFSSVNISINSPGQGSITLNNITSSPKTINNNINANTLYTFTVTPVNSANVANTNVSDNGSFTTGLINTYATIGILNTRQITGSNIIIYWQSGTYTTVNMYNNSQLTSNISQSYYNYTGLVPNTQYTFQANALNKFGLSNTTNNQCYRYITTTSAATVSSNLFGDVRGANGTTTAIINLGSSTDYWNSYSYVNLIVVQTNPPLPPAQSQSQVLNTTIYYPTTTYTLGGLSPNTTYTITAIPYNNINVANVNPTVATFTTQPFIDNSSIYNIPETIASANFTFTSLNSYTSALVQLYNTTDANVLVNSQTVISNNSSGVTTTSVINYNNLLLPNHLYTIKVIPYNYDVTVTSNIFQSGPLYTTSFTSLPNVSPISITYYDASVVTFTWNYITGQGHTFNNNQITIQNLNNSNIVLQTLTPVNTFTYTKSNLIPNTGYSIRLLPFNDVNVPSYSNIQSAYVDQLGTIGSVYVSAIDTSNVSLSWSGGLYDTVTTYVRRTADYSLITSQSNITGTLYSSATVSPNVLAANTLYSGRIVPVNTEGVPDYINASNINFTTLPVIYSIGLTSTDSNVTVYLNGIYSTIGITSNAGYFNTLSSPFPTLTTPLSTTINNLYPNTNYAIQALPYNSVHALGTTVGTSIYTLGTVGNITFPTITSSSIRIRTDGAYNNITIKWTDVATNTLTSNTNLTAASNTISGLVADSLYQFTILPYNNSLVLGTTKISSTVYTLASVTNFTQANVATNLVTLDIEGLYTSYDVVMSSLHLSYAGTSNYYTVYGLTENTQYPISVIPINHYGLSNLTIAPISITTLSLITQLHITPFINTFVTTWNNSPGQTATNISITGVVDSTGAPFVYNQLFNNVAGTSYTLPYSLSPNVMYTLAFTPVNSIGLLNNSEIVTNTLATLATISSAGNTGYDTTSATLNWNSTATNMNITYSYTNAITSGNSAVLLNYGANSNVTLGLIPNTSYIFNLYPINQCNVTNTNFTQTSLTTLATISPATITSYTPTNALISWNSQPSANTYTSVTVIASNITPGTPPYQTLTYQGITQSSFNIPQNALAANTPYSISVLCYNSQNAETLSYRKYLPILTTLGTANNLTISGLLSTQFNVNWSGSNSTVSIVTSNMDTGVPFTISGIPGSLYAQGSSYLINRNIIPNTKYSISVIPFNSVNIPNISSTQIIYITTLASPPTLQYVASTASSITLQLNGGIYTSNTITWFNTNTPQIILQTTIGTQTITIPSLQTNGVYTFTVYPINSQYVTNTTEYNTLTSAIKSVAYLSPVPITNLTNTSFVINWQSGAYQYVIVNWNIVGDATVYQSAQINNGTFSYLIGTGSSGNGGAALQENTLYSITVTPYGNGGQGISASTTVTTLSTVVTTITNITSSNITLSNVGTYLYNNITWVDTNGNGSNVYTGATLFTAPAVPATSTNLLPNMYYTFSVTPYNTARVANNNGIYTIAGTTLARVGISSNYNVLSHSLTESWQYDPAGQYTSVAVGWAFSNNPGSNIATIYGIQTRTQNITNLIPNTNYIFTVRPYNSVGVSNVLEVSQNSLLTLAYIDTMYFTQVTSTSATLNWSSLYPYNYVIIIYNVVGSANVIATQTFYYNAGNTYTVSGLAPNTTYTFTIIPYNANGVANAVEQAVANVVTLGTITSVSILNKSIGNANNTSADFTIGWTGIFSSVGLYWTNGVASGSLSSVGGFSTTLGAGLIANSNYTVTVTPYNSNTVNLPNTYNLHQPGVSLYTTGYTLATVNNIITTSSENTITLTWDDHYNTYNYVGIAFNGSNYLNSNQFNPNYTVYTFKGLTTSTTYNFVLTAYNNQTPTPDASPSILVTASTLGTYQFTAFNYITGTVAASNAPSLAALTALPNYSGASAAAVVANMSYFNNTPGYQFLTLPSTGYYTLTAAGAAGGSNYLVNQPAGYGAIISGTFYFNTDTDKLIAVPGLSGTSTSLSTLGGGGGGATSVFKYTIATGVVKPIMVAAGGGGTSSIVATLTSGTSNAANTFVTESILSLNTTNAVAAGSSTQTQMNTANTYPQPTISSGSPPYTIYGANGANGNGTARTSGGFGGGGAGLVGIGGGGGGWKGSQVSSANKPGYGGTTEMYVSYASNVTFTGYNPGNGYVTIATTLYPILSVAAIPITNITWGSVIVNWGTLDLTNISYVVVSWLGDANTNYDNGISGQLTNTTSYVVNNLKYSQTTPYNYTFSITPYDLQHLAGTPLIGISANAYADNTVAYTVPMPILGTVLPATTPITNRTISSFTVNWLTGLSTASSGISNVVVQWTYNDGTQIVSPPIPYVDSTNQTYSTLAYPSLLTVNTSYTFSVTPYDIYNRPGYTSNITGVTLGLVATSNIVNISPTSFNVYWASVSNAITPTASPQSPSYSYVGLNILQGANTVYTNSYAYGSNIVPNVVFAPNTQYTIKITPYNISSNANTGAVVVASNMTFASIPTPTISNIDPYTFNTTLSNISTYSTANVALQYYTSGISTGQVYNGLLPGVTFTESSLLPNTNYLLITTPINSSNILTPVAYIISQSNVTLAMMSNLSLPIYSNMDPYSFKTTLSNLAAYSLPQTYSAANFLVQKGGINVDLLPSQPGSAASNNNIQPGSNFVTSNLQPNTIYTIYTTPINSVGALTTLPQYIPVQTNVTYATIPVSTLSNVDPYSFVATLPTSAAQTYSTATASIALYATGAAAGQTYTNLSFGVQYKESNLLPNTNYSINTVPINSVGTVTPQVYSTTQSNVTLAMISNLSLPTFSNMDAYSFKTTLSNLAAYSLPQTYSAANFLVQKGGINVDLLPSQPGSAASNNNIQPGSNFVTSNLQPNTIYTIYTTPINSVGALTTLPQYIPVQTNVTYATIPVSTLSNVDPYSFVATLPTSAAQTYSTATASITLYPSGIPSGTTYTNQLPGTQYKESNLQPNTTYNITTQPFNSIGVPSPAIYTVSQTDVTYAMIASTSLPTLSNIDPYSFKTTLSNLAAYSLPQTYSAANFLIQQNGVNIDQLAQPGSAASNNNIQPGNNFISSNLQPNTKYTIYTTPINSVGTLTPLSQYITVQNNVTLATITGSTISNVDPYSFIATLPTSTTYSTVSVALTVYPSGTPYGNTYYGQVAGTQYRESNLLPNTTYTIITTPYNSLGVPSTGPYVITQTDATLAVIPATSLPTFSNMDAYSFKTTLSNVATMPYSAANFLIQQGGVNIDLLAQPGSAASNNNIQPGNSFVSSNLQPNTNYTIYTTPISAVGTLTGSPYIVSQSNVTYATIPPLLFSANDPYHFNITMPISSTYSTASVAVSLNGVGVNVPYPEVPGNQFTVYSLGPNITYNITTTPYNSAGVVSPQQYITTQQNTTLAIMSNLPVVSNVTLFTIGVGLSNAITYSSANILLQVNGVNAAPPATASNNGFLVGSYNTISNLLPNTMYNIYTTPVNLQGVPSTAQYILSQSNLTYAQMQPLTFSNVDPTRFIAALSNSITYTKANCLVQLNGVNVSSPATASNIGLNAGSNLVSSNLLPNTLYTVYSTPINSAGILTPYPYNYLVQSNVTYAQMQPLTFSNVDPSRFIATLSNSITYTTANCLIQLNGINVPSPATASNIGILAASNLVASNLLPNTLYTVYSTPINSAGALTPPPYILSQSNVTYAQMQPLIFSNVDPTRFIATLSNTITFTKVNCLIQLNGVNVQSPATASNMGILAASNLVASNLSPNTLYTVYSTPINSVGILTPAPYILVQSNVTYATYSSNVIQVYPSVNANNLASNAFTIVTNSSSMYSTTNLLTQYNGVNISIGASNTGIIAGNSITVSNLQPNSNYIWYATPVNSAGVPSPLSQIYTNNITTLATIPNSTFSNVDPYSYTITFPTINTYSNVIYSVYNNAIQVGSSLRCNVSTMYKQTGLLPNTIYSINNTPVNSANVTSPYFTTQSNLTYALMQSLTISNVDPTRFIATLSNSITYSSVNCLIQQNGVNVASPATASNIGLLPGSNLVASNLLPNTLYTIYSTPINSASILTPAPYNYLIQSNVTYAQMQPLTFSNVDPTLFIATLSNCITYTKANCLVQLNGVNVTSPATASNIGIYAGSNLVSSNLQPNTLYTVYSTPINSAGILSPSASILVQSNVTYATYVSAPSTVYVTTTTSNSFTISTQVNSSYSTTNILAQYNGVNLSIGASNNGIVGGNSVTINNLQPNSNYTWYATPINSAGVLSPSSLIYSTSITTRATMPLSTISNVDPYSYSITFPVSSNYSSVIYSGSGVQIASTFNPGNNYIQTGLLPNTTYSIVTTPQNSAYVPSPLYANTQYDLTYALMQPLTFSNMDSQSFTATLSNSITYSSANCLVQLNGINVSGGATASNIGLYPGSNFVTSNLQPNTKYTIYSTPINSAGILTPSPYNYLVQTNVTLGTVGQVAPTYANITGTSMSISYTPGVASRYAIQYSTGYGSSLAPSTAPTYYYIDSFNSGDSLGKFPLFLQPNTQYAFNIVAVNSVGQSNLFQPSLTASTWTMASMGSDTITFNSTTSSNTLVSYVPGAASSYTLQYSQGSTVSATPTTSNNFISGQMASNLSPNTQYAFKVIPINGSNVAGTPTPTSTVTTLALPASISAVYTNSTTATVTWANTAAGGTALITTTPTNVGIGGSYINASTSPATFSGLVTGTAYTFNLYAVNSASSANLINTISTSSTLTLYNTPVLSSVSAQNGNTSGGAFTIPISQSASITGTLVYSINSNATYTTATSFTASGSTPGLITLTGSSGTGVTVNVASGTVITNQPVYVFVIGPLYTAIPTSIPAVSTNFTVTTVTNLYPYTTFTFTRIGATGNNGPTSLTGYGTTYPGYGTTSALTVTSGIQKWIVPITGTYKLIAAGASGGPGNGGGVLSGGVIISNTLTLTVGQVIYIAVGQAGDNYGTGGSGGGGTFIATSNIYPLTAAYPPVALTGTTTTVTGQTSGNGTYTVNSSTQAYQAYQAFDKNSYNSLWAGSGAYSNSSPYNYLTTNVPLSSLVISGITYNGDWLSITLPTAIVLTSYSITARGDNSVGQTPSQWIIAGSNNGGTTWTLVTSQTIASPFTYLGQQQVFNLLTNASTPAYNSYVILVTNISAANGVTSIGEWSLNPNGYTSYLPLLVAGGGGGAWGGTGDNGQLTTSGSAGGGGGGGVGGINGNGGGTTDGHSDDPGGGFYTNAGGGTNTNINGGIAFIYGAQNTTSSRSRFGGGGPAGDGGGGARGGGGGGYSGGGGTSSGGSGACGGGGSFDITNTINQNTNNNATLLTSYGNSGYNYSNGFAIIYLTSAVSQFISNTTLSISLTAVSATLSWSLPTPTPSAQVLTFPYNMSASVSIPTLTGTSTSAAITGLTPGTLYCVILTMSLSGYADLILSNTFTTPALTVSSFTASSTTPTSVTLSWSPASGTSYSVITWNSQNSGNITGTSYTASTSISGNAYVTFTIIPYAANGNVTGTSSTYTVYYDGSTSALAGSTAVNIMSAYTQRGQTASDGVYWINLPSIGATQIYCIMNTNASGGGWMMAMKATRGITFSYSSSYWTTNNTLNPTDNTRNDADAKFNTMNYYAGTQLLALFPDVTGYGNGSLGSSNPYGCWSWLQNYSSLFSNTSQTMLYLFNNASNSSCGLYSNFSGWNNQIWSAQGGNNFYGFNFTYGRGALRWGFGFNNENDWNSDDVSGGIGMDGGSYSAGDYTYYYGYGSSGLNRTMRVEIYIR